MVFLVLHPEIVWNKLINEPENATKLFCPKTAKPAHKARKQTMKTIGLSHPNAENIHKRKEVIVSVTSFR